MQIQAFFQTFYLVFLILIAVGPGFLTIANIAMMKGYKTSAIAVCGCFFGDCILITLGANLEQKAITTLPKTLLTTLSFAAVVFLYHLSIKFLRTDISKITIPILSFCGSDEYPTYLKQELLKEKAINCPDYSYEIIENTNHFYKNKEDVISRIVKEWINKRF